MPDDPAEFKIEPVEARFELHQDFKFPIGGQFDDINQVVFAVRIFSPDGRKQPFRTRRQYRRQWSCKKSSLFPQPFFFGLCKERKKRSQKHEIFLAKRSVIKYLCDPSKSWKVNLDGDQFVRELC